jgi:two-component system nitrogen regulation response regulator GlnG
LRCRWPGNVRELENVIYRSAVVAQGETILLKDLPPEIRDAVGAGAAAAVPVSNPNPAAPAPAAQAVEAAPPAVEPRLETAPPAAPSPESESAVEPVAPTLSLKDALDYVYAQLKAEGGGPVLERLEREMMERVLKDEKGNLVRASERLGMTRTTLRKRIDALRLKV